MIQLQRNHNGPGVSECNLRLRLAYGFLTPSLWENSDLIRKWHLFWPAFPTYNGISFNIHNMHQMSWVTQPYLNPSSHGPTSSSKQLVAICFWPMLTSNLPHCSQNPGKVLGFDEIYASPIHVKGNLEGCSFGFPRSPLWQGLFMAESLSRALAAGPLLSPCTFVSLSEHNAHSVSHLFHNRDFTLNKG